jgi:hypothetical protein
MASRTVVMGILVGRKPVGVHPDAHGARESAQDFHLANTQGAFELNLDDLVRQFGQFPPRADRRESEMVMTPTSFGVELCDHGGSASRGNSPPKGGDAIAHVFERFVVPFGSGQTG